MNQNLNCNYSDEKPINFVNLIFHVLRKWKVLLIVAVIAAIAAAGVIGVMNRQAGSDIQTEEDTVKLSKTEREAYQVKKDALEEKQQIIKEYDAYLNNSIKVKLNPNGFYEGTAKYLFSAENREELLVAAALCEKTICSDDSFSKLSKKLSDTPKVAYIREVVSVYEETEINDLPDTMIMQDNNTETVVVIGVQHYNKEQCKVMLKHVRQKMQEAQEQLAAENVQADVRKIASGVRTYQDSTLVELSNSIQSAKMLAHEELTAIKKNMTAKEQQYYRLEQAQIKNDGTTESGEAPEGGEQINWMYAPLAGLAAVCFAAIIYVLAYLFGDCIHNREELEVCVAVPVMTVQGAGPKNKVDAALLAAEKHISGTAEHTTEMLAVMLKKFAAQNDTKTLFITGSRNIVSAEGAVSELKELLAADGIELTMGNSILKDSEALTEAIDCGFVVFWEKCDASFGKDIQEEVKKILSCEGKVLGVVLEQG